MRRETAHPAATARAAAQPADADQAGRSAPNLTCSGIDDAPRSHLNALHSQLLRGVRPGISPGRRSSIALSNSAIVSRLFALTDAFARSSQARNLQAKSQSRFLVPRRTSGNWPSSLLNLRAHSNVVGAIVARRSWKSSVDCSRGGESGSPSAR